ncbi:histidine kinase [Atopomonas sediminilitoris]|uniref:histidine kinase n=1 Tax=Atopomonas sediminilitoris TaxID=2919919 RepID=UPI001FD982A6|nr:histidine kinase [Atopomonas sediminilitoris]
MLIQALRRKRISLSLRVAAHSLFLVAFALLIYAWVMGMQFRQAMQQQADALGQSLVIQTGASATELLVANDLLSLNVLLNNLTKNPLVAHAAIYSVDNRILAEAGARPHALIGEPEGLYSTNITFQEVIAGYLRVSLDMRQFYQPMTISLQSMGILSLILIALSISLSLRLGRSLAMPLQELRLWLRDPDDPAPGSARMDEIGELSRQLQARLVAAKPAPSVEVASAPQLNSADTDAEEDLDDDLRHEPHWDDAALDGPHDGLEQHAPEALNLPWQSAEDAAELEEDPEPESWLGELITPDEQDELGEIPGETTVLAVQLGAQEQLRRLPRHRLVELLERYRGSLERAAQLYNGQLHTLNDGSSLILFHSDDCAEDHTGNALCCAELLRGLGHALQVEVADSGLTLQLQLGLAVGDSLQDLPQGELLLSEATEAALALSQHSRNLVLLDQSISSESDIRHRAKLRPITSPAGACCVERLLEPYQSLLDNQLNQMFESPAE